MPVGALAWKLCDLFFIGGGCALSVGEARFKISDYDMWDQDNAAGFKQRDVRCFLVSVTSSFGPRFSGSQIGPRFGTWMPHGLLNLAGWSSILSARSLNLHCFALLRKWLFSMSMPRRTIFSKKTAKY